MDSNSNYCNTTDDIDIKLFYYRYDFGLYVGCISAFIVGVFFYSLRNISGSASPPFSRISIIYTTLFQIILLIIFLISELFKKMFLFIPLPKKYFHNYLLKRENLIGTFGVSIARAKESLLKTKLVRFQICQLNFLYQTFKSCLKMERLFFVPLPLKFQVAFGCWKFTLGMLLCFFSETADLILDLVYFYYLGTGKIIDRRIHVSTIIQVCLFAFVLIGRRFNKSMTPWV